MHDLETSDLGQTGLDLVLSHLAVHHIRNLEFVFDNVHKALRPGGIFHLKEFVGPDRFQWTDRHLEEMNGWLATLPDKYRRTPDGRMKYVTGRASVAEMIADDPTESVRSSAIMPLLAERFDILAHHHIGGTLTMMTLAEIAQNFDPPVEEDAAHLRRLLDRERDLMETGAIGSDFVVVTARRRG